MKKILTELLKAIEDNIETLNVGDEFGKDKYQPVVKIQYIADEIHSAKLALSKS